MLFNYLKIAWRNLLGSKIYSLLILAGLSCGMTCAIVLGLYVKDELSFDGYHRNSADIYRLILDIKWLENRYNMATAATPFGPALQRDYPEIKNTLRVKAGNQVFRNGENALNVKKIIFADTSLFSFFDYDFTEGSPATALTAPHQVVLTEKLAAILFGKTSGLIGKTVYVKDNIPFTVSGIIREVPSNHHLKFDAVLPYGNREVSGAQPDNWGNFNTITYVMVPDAQAISALEAKMPAFYKKYVAETLGDTGSQKVSFLMSFQPLRDIHLHSAHLLGEENGSTMRYVYTISVIAFFILLIAIVNYINLATARATARAKEIGVRKAIGSQRAQLIGQFLAESLLVSMLALSASILLLYILLPFFNQLADKQLSLDIASPEIAGFFLAFLLLIGLVSGLYPAFVLSKYNPAVVLKGPLASKSQGSLLRQSLVVLQFTISIVMIVGTIVVYQQLQYMSSKELGFNQQQVIRIPLKNPSAQQSAPALKKEILKNPLITFASLTNGSIGADMNNKSSFSFYYKGVEATISSEYFNVDEDLVDVLQMQVMAGRNFSGKLDSDSSDAVLVNQAMLRRLGWKTHTNGLIEIDTHKTQITGVVNDFHLRSLHSQIEPLVLILKRNRYDNILVKIAGGNVPAALTAVRDAFKRINPGQPFEYEFLDQVFARQYESDERRGTFFLLFSGIAILIACIGLFGLATFTAQQRTKEIGVRKVLGASVASVVALLSADFLKLVAIAIIIASPLGWYLMNTWLKTFAYKVDIAWWVFALAGLISIIIALITVSFHSIRAALMNPVRSLRTE